MHILICLLLFGLSCTTVLAAPLHNRLAGHASPYLAMHGQDPVHWQEWNAASVAQARKQGKLLFVSSGYFSCHWCHVMQQESYQHTDIARLLNAHFIPVKVDRELNAALDGKLIDFVEKTQGIAGWPLNVFITPEGYPLVGMVYVPPDNFLQVIEKLKTEWQNSRIALSQLARDVSHELQPAVPDAGTTLTPALLADYQALMIKQSFANADELQGGFGEESKFPSVPQLQTLLRVYARTQERRLYDFLNLTLEQMASQGLRDHLGGGFYRYVVDPGWQLPHFEKMLYDNALLVGLYLEAAKVLQRPQYRKVAAETLNFMQTQMRLPGGGLLASFSAIDERGVEGGYYLWSAAEVKNLLSAEEWQIAEAYWGLRGAPELDAGHHLLERMGIGALVQQRGWSEKSIQQQLQSATTKLLTQRQQRQLPRDPKALAAWNGLALSAYVAAGREGLLERQAVEELKNFIQTQLWDGKRLYRMKSAAGYAIPGDLEDYAYVSQALLAWAMWQNTAADWTLLETLVTQAWQKFYGPQGWKLAEDSLLKYREVQPLTSDGPMPSAAAVLLKTTLELASRRQHRDLQAQALTALGRGHEVLRAETFWHASYLDALYTQQELSASK
ncbi:MAG: DUF255 domain-containing protein [Gammaproteobacteria bacterium]